MRGARTTRCASFISPIWMGENSAGAAPAEIDMVVLMWLGRKSSVYQYGCDEEENRYVWAALGVGNTQLLYVNLVHSVLHAASTSPC